MCSARRSTPRVPSGCASIPPAARWTSARARAGCRRTTSSRTSTPSWPRPKLAIDTHHDPSFDSMLRIALAPCSPFSVTGELAAGLGRPGPRARACGCTPTCARRSTRRTTAGSTSTPPRWSTWRASAGSGPTSGTPTRSAGRRVDRQDGRHRHQRCALPVLQRPARLGHRPGPRHARCRASRSGSGVDGAASNEYCALWEELRHAVLFARAKGGPQALTVRDAVDMATMGGARVLGRQDEIGSLEVGKLADLAVWRLDTLPHIDIADPVAALVLGASAAAGTAAGQRAAGRRAGPTGQRRPGRVGPRKSSRPASGCSPESAVIRVTGSGAGVKPRAPGRPPPACRARSPRYLLHGHPAARAGDRQRGPERQAADRYRDTADPELLLAVVDRVPLPADHPERRDHGVRVW